MVKLSNYTLVIPLKKPKEYLLYNTLSETLVCIYDEQNKIVGRKTWDTDIVSKNKEIFEQLCDLGFLIKDEVNEAELTKKTLWKWRFDTTLLEIRILPTYWCNFDCTYCYQNEFDRSLTMNKAICEEMLIWIEHKVKEFMSTRVNIKFFGGEVLGNMPLMETICKRLKKLSLLNNFELHFDLTTNGSLLIPPYVNRIKSWGIDTVKITIDGNEVTHNQMRPFINGKGSFKKIVKNIAELDNKINIILRCNYNKNNLKTIPTLLDYLAQKGLNEQLVLLEFQPILLRRNFSYKNNNHHCTKSIFTKQQIKQLLWLIKAALDRGFRVNTALNGGRCSAFFKSSFLIDPIGDIYKCPAFIGNSQHIIGTVKDNRLNYFSETFLTDDSWKDCIDCSFVPICCGGCRYAAQEKFGDFYGNKICNKEYFEKVGLNILKLTYNY